MHKCNGNAHISEILQQNVEGILELCNFEWTVRDIKGKGYFTSMLLDEGTDMRCLSGGESESAVGSAAP